MSSGKENNGCGKDKRSNQMIIHGAINNGKGITKINGEEDGRSGGHQGDRELLAVKERKRRRQISEMFTELHGLLPILHEKVDKPTIVMEAIHYIKSLEGVLSKLEKRKMEEHVQGKILTTANSGISSSRAAAKPIVLKTQLTSPPTGGTWPTREATWPTNDVGAMTAEIAPVRLQTWSRPNIVLSLFGNHVNINVCVEQRPGMLTGVMVVLDKHNIDVITSTIVSDNTRTIFTIQAQINGVSNLLGDNVAAEKIYKSVVSEIMVWLPK
ncbi:transcription factor bHLH95-like [Triticum dicoccoides]|uniref:transcription factor bHLH95-like n=1 Tax=Triticum dicoccoides TaxID=85692 RepID=UPI001890FEB1|nr:transcription factor bHLH95-like [Triticum dicoccoides]